MSIRLMASAWDLDIPSTEKMVLLCLCDFSNDHGVCWPSVPTIAAKCSKGHRTVQAAIQWLRNEGYCSWDETPGRPHRFSLNPRKICTPAKSAPPQELQDTPAELADEPSITINSSEAKASSPRAWALPVGVSLQVWNDFLSNRKRKRLGQTETAWKGFNDDLRRVSAHTGIPPPRLIEQCTARGWGAIYDPRDQGNGQQRTNGMGRHQSADGLSPTTRAAVAVFGVPEASEQRRLPR